MNLENLSCMLSFLAVGYYVQRQHSYEYHTQLFFLTVWQTARRLGKL